MKDLHHRRPKGYGSLPLFDWVTRRDTAMLTTAGAWLYRHRRVPRSMANTLAELAGLGERMR